MSIQGQVKWFDPKKGYGFIIGPSGQDVFVHYSQIEQEGFRLLKDGEHVDYELVESEKGFQARAVQRHREANGASRDAAESTADGESASEPSDDSSAGHDGAGAETASFRPHRSEG